MSGLPDYVLSEAEDRTRTRYVTPSNISPWRDGISQMPFLTETQCRKLREMGIDPATADWLWVTVPVTDPFDAYDRYAYGRVVQKLACPIIRTVGDRIQVLAPKGRLCTVYAGGRLSKPDRKRQVRGFMGRG